MNFFDLQCQEPALNHTLFGLCDKPEERAYLDIGNPKTWIATVKNDNGKTIIFTAIDKCVIKDGELIGEGRCDCMLTYTDNIIFIELKIKGKQWMEEGLNQIEATLKHFTQVHNLSAIKHKRAFVVNRRHPYFHTIEDERMKRIFDTYRVRLNVQAEIMNGPAIG